MCHKHSIIKIEFVINLLSYLYVGIDKQCHSFQKVYLNNLHIYPALIRLVFELREHVSIFDRSTNYN
jgi:hypothetical protein